MKKIVTFTIALFSLILLAACSKANFSAIITISDYNVGYDSISFELTAVDPDSELGNVIAEVRLNNKTEHSIDASIANKNTIGNLNSDTEYKLVISATINDKKELMTEQTFTTQKDGSSAEYPKTLSNKEDLMAVYEIFKPGSTSTTTEKQTVAKTHYILSADIDLENEEFVQPIFSSSSYPFSGSIDGKGFAIKNAQFKSQSANGLSLVGQLGMGTVKNITFDSINVNHSDSRTSYTAVVAHRISSSEATIEEVTVSNSVIDRAHGGSANTNLYVGFISGHAQGTVKNVYVNDSIVKVLTGRINGAKDQTVSGDLGTYVGTVFGIYKDSKLQIDRISGLYSNSDIEFTYNTTGPEKDPNMGLYIGGLVGRLSVTTKASNFGYIGKIDIQQLDNNTSKTDLADEFYIGGAIGVASSELEEMYVKAEILVGSIKEISHVYIGLAVGLHLRSVATTNLAIDGASVITVENADNPAVVVTGVSNSYTSTTDKVNNAGFITSIPVISVNGTTGAPAGSVKTIAELLINEDVIAFSEQ